MNGLSRSISMGAILAGDKARIDVADRGLLLGDGLFETLRAYAGQPFAWPIICSASAAPPASSACPCRSMRLNWSRALSMSWRPTACRRPMPRSVSR